MGRSPTDALMPRFDPFPAIRYAPGSADLRRVTSPPYDVIDAEQRAALAATDPHNAVLVDLPLDADGGGAVDRYAVAQQLLASWRETGVLVDDATPTFTVHRMAYTDDAGVERHTTGVLGALELTDPGTGDAPILPHEHTTPKAKSDRLDLLRATRANLSAIWGLSLAKGLTDLFPTDAAPNAEFVDDDGVRHSLWIIDDADRCAAIASAVAEQPVVIADGHHRYETSLAYRREREASDGDAGAARATLAYVVELVDEELTVRAIHRLLGSVPAGTDLVAALEPWFEPVGSPPNGEPVTAAMQRVGALCVVTADGETLVRPRSEALADARDLDSSRLDIALAALGITDVAYQHGVDNVRRLVDQGACVAGVLLRPATVAQIEATAHGGERMPPKTTFFHPKPRTGLVFRALD